MKATVMYGGCCCYHHISPILASIAPDNKNEQHICVWNSTIGNMCCTFVTAADTVTERQKWTRTITAIMALRCRRVPFRQCIEYIVLARFSFSQSHPGFFRQQTQNQMPPNTIFANMNSVGLSSFTSVERLRAVRVDRDREEEFYRTNVHYSCCCYIDAFHLLFVPLRPHGGHGFLRQSAPSFTVTGFCLVVFPGAGKFESHRPFKDS